MTFGSLLGLVGGYFGGATDAVLGKIVDVWLGLPAIIMALLIITLLGVGIDRVVLAVGIAGVPRFARIARGQTLSIRQNTYVEAARASGATDGRIILRHILANATPSLIVFATLRVGGAILQGSGLGFLGLGVQPPAPEWGTMLSEARDYMRHAPWLMIFPGAMVFLTVVCVNMLGDFLRTVIDPRLRGR
jgi:ABC-type dipeptide/oligopeptide/nickel transport system permease subunit